MGELCVIRTRERRQTKVAPAGVAQVVEQWTENPRVGGSTPSPGTTSFEGA